MDGAKPSASMAATVHPVRPWTKTVTAYRLLNVPASTKEENMLLAPKTSRAMARRHKYGEFKR